MKIVRYQTTTGQILTGTPHGVGGARKPPVFPQPGDSVTIEIDGIGALTNPVVAEGDVP
jgi:2-keto-4-pentenoate hydratase/2-oxohepta-3-ene-1,7-dioic acid hydratase in catechol pathway